MLIAAGLALGTAASRRGFAEDARTAAPTVDASRPGPAGVASPTPGTAATPLRGVRPLELDLDALRKTLAAVPVLASLSGQFQPFAATDVDSALRRGGRSRESIHVWTIMPSAFVWTPRAGRELWVLSGRSGGRALIAVLEPKGAQTFAHAASLTLHEPEATVAVGYSDQYPDQLVWSSCYGCAGEGGTVRSLEDGRVEFGYR